MRPRSRRRRSAPRLPKLRVRLPDLPLVAGGKSFGGRMTSQAQARSPLPGVRGLVFLGFPLHPAGKPSDERGAHLVDVAIPMLFLQGTRDELADLRLLQALVGTARRRGRRSTLFDGADHSFHVPARTGRKDAEIRAELADAFAAGPSGRSEPSPTGSSPSTG